MLVLVVLAALLAVTGKDAGQWLLVLGGWLGVMVVELLNSADEESFDLVTTEWNEHVKRGKDMASAAIFLAMVINAGCRSAPCRRTAPCVPGSSAGIRCRNRP